MRAACTKKIFKLLCCHLWLSYLKWKDYTFCYILDSRPEKTSRLLKEYSPFLYSFNMANYFESVEMFGQVSISSTFYLRLLRWYFCSKKLQSQNVTREKLCKTLLYEKLSRKMLMKLTPVRRKRVQRAGSRSSCQDFVLWRNSDSLQFDSPSRKGYNFDRL